MKTPTAADLRERFDLWPSERLLEVTHPASGYSRTAVLVALELLDERGIDRDGEAAQATFAALDVRAVARADLQVSSLGWPLDGCG